MGIRRGKTERVIGGTEGIARHSRCKICSNLSIHAERIVGGGRWIVFL